jgi:hypothetical protein
VLLGGGVAVVVSCGAACAPPAACVSTPIPDATPSTITTVPTSNAVTSCWRRDVVDRVVDVAMHQMTAAPCFAERPANERAVTMP